MVASTLPAELYDIPFNQYVQHGNLTPLGMGDTTSTPTSLHALGGDRMASSDKGNIFRRAEKKAG
jgi:hypothetical protein